MKGEIIEYIIHRKLIDSELLLTSTRKYRQISTDKFVLELCNEDSKSFNYYMKTQPERNCSFWEKIVEIAFAKEHLNWTPQQWDKVQLLLTNQNSIDLDQKCM